MGPKGPRSTAKAKVKAKAKAKSKVAPEKSSNKEASVDESPTAEEAAGADSDGPGRDVDEPAAADVHLPEEAAADGSEPTGQDVASDKPARQGAPLVETAAAAGEVSEKAAVDGSPTAEEVAAGAGAAADREPGGVDEPAVADVHLPEKAAANGSEPTGQEAASDKPAGQGAPLAETAAAAGESPEKAAPETTLVEPPILETAAANLVTSSGPEVGEQALAPPGKETEEADAPVPSRNVTAEALPLPSEPRALSAAQAASGAEGGKGESEADKSKPPAPASTVPVGVTEPLAAMPVPEESATAKETQEKVSPNAEAKDATMAEDATKGTAPAQDAADPQPVATQAAGEAPCASSAAEEPQSLLLQLSKAMGEAEGETVTDADAYMMPEEDGPAAAAAAATFSDVYACGQESATGDGPGGDMQRRAEEVSSAEEKKKVDTIASGATPEMSYGVMDVEAIDDDVPVVSYERNLFSKEGRWIVPKSDTFPSVFCALRVRIRLEPDPDGRGTSPKSLNSSAVEGVLRDGLELGKTLVHWQDAPDIAASSDQVTTAEAREIIAAINGGLPKGREAGSTVKAEAWGVVVSVIALTETNDDADVDRISSLKQCFQKAVVDDAIVCELPQLWIIPDPNFRPKLASIGLYPNSFWMGFFKSCGPVVAADVFFRTAAPRVGSPSKPVVHLVVKYRDRESLKSCFSFLYERYLVHPKQDKECDLWPPCCRLADFQDFKAKALSGRKQTGMAKAPSGRPKQPPPALTKAGQSGSAAPVMMPTPKTRPTPAAGKQIAAAAALPSKALPGKALSKATTQEKARPPAKGVPVPAASKAAEFDRALTPAEAMQGLSGRQLEAFKMVMTRMERLEKENQELMQILLQMQGLLQQQQERNVKLASNTPGSDQVATQRSTSQPADGTRGTSLVAPAAGGLPLGPLAALPGTPGLPQHLSMGSGLPFPTAPLLTRSPLGMPTAPAPGLMAPTAVGLVRAPPLPSQQSFPLSSPLLQPPGALPLLQSPGATAGTAPAAVTATTSLSMNGAPAAPIGSFPGASIPLAAAQLPAASMGITAPPRAPPPPLPPLPPMPPASAEPPRILLGAGQSAPEPKGAISGSEKRKAPEPFVLGSSAPSAMAPLSAQAVTQPASTADSQLSAAPEAHAALAATGDNAAEEDEGAEDEEAPWKKQRRRPRRTPRKSENGGAGPGAGAGEASPGPSGTGGLAAYHNALLGV